MPFSLALRRHSRNTLLNRETRKERCPLTPFPPLPPSPTHNQDLTTQPLPTHPIGVAPTTSLLKRRPMSYHHCNVSGCDFKGKSRSSLVIHKKYCKHGDPPEFPCSKCDLVFRRVFDLTDHVLTEHREKTRKQSLQDLLAGSQNSSRASSRNTTPSSTPSQTPTPSPAPTPRPRETPLP